MGTILLFAVLILIYILPSMIAWNRKHSNGIFVLNLFLGWTFIGWIGALIWAVSSEKIN